MNLIVPHTPSSEIAIERFELAETLSPGGQASAYLLLWDAFAKDFVRTTMTATLYDAARSVNHGDNFGLTGEHFAARYHPDSGRYECVGSRGLFRHAKADAAISDGAVGTATIWTDDPLVTSGVVVDVDNTWSGQAIASGDKILLRYVKGTGVWAPIVSGSVSAELVSCHFDLRYSYLSFSPSVGATVPVWCNGPRSQPVSGLFEWDSSANSLVHKQAGAYLAIAHYYYEGTSSNSEGDILRLQFLKNGTDSMDVSITDIELVDLKDSNGTAQLQSSGAYHIVYNMTADDEMSLRILSVFPGPAVPQFVLFGEMTILKFHGTADWNGVSVPTV